MEYKDFIKENGISMECKAGGICPDDFKDSDPWVCKIKCEDREFELPFFTGKGFRKCDEKALLASLGRFYNTSEREKAVARRIENILKYKDRYKSQQDDYARLWKPVAPSIEDVLDCLASDASGFGNSRTFEEWADEYGYDSDSRKAEKTYNAVAENTKKLKNLLGHDLYEKLLFEVERL